MVFAVCILIATLLMRKIHDQLQIGLIISLFVYAKSNESLKAKYT